MYGVSAGEYAGRCLCYDCCQEIVAQNVADLTANKEIIKRQFTIQLIGMAIGFLLGMGMGIAGGIESGGIGGFFGGVLYGFFAGLIWAGLFGVFWSYLKASLAACWEGIKMLFQGEWIAAIIYMCIQSFVLGFKAIFATIKNTIFYINYLKKTSGFIEEDSACLQQMRDYMEYTLVRNQNKGVDLATLMNQGSQLYNNSYAQAVRSNGEAAADAALRQATTRIAENGEIIRDFPGAAAA